ncbi:MAG: DNA segregation ATPase FtsK/SpoIIIE-like protein [bacterium]|jgi:DNA segregation ATPase FtsK/SpoIIIE-like protein
MKRWFKRNGVELVLGIGASLFFINFFTDQADDLYIISIPLVVYGFIRLYKRHFCRSNYFVDNYIESMSGDEDDDDLYEEAKSIAIESGKVSTSYLQRKLRIGYSRTARLMDLLEENGIIGPPMGSGSREVLKDETL